MSNDEFHRFITTGENPLSSRGGGGNGATTNTDSRKAKDSTSKSYDYSTNSSIGRGSSSNVSPGGGGGGGGGSRVSSSSFNDGLDEYFGGKDRRDADIHRGLYDDTHSEEIDAWEPLPEIPLDAPIDDDVGDDVYVDPWAPSSSDVHDDAKRGESTKTTTWEEIRARNRRR